MNKEKKQLTLKVDFQTSNVVLELEHGVHAKAQKRPTKKPWNTRRKTCIFDCSLRLNFSRKRHFATKILLVA
jgi:hypothetical protein